MSHVRSSDDDLPETEIVGSGAILISPRTNTGPYAPPCWLLTWVLSGRATVRSERRTWELLPGSVHLCPPGVTARWEWDPELTIREGSIHFRSAGSLDWPRYRRFAPTHVVPTLLAHLLWLSAERPAGWARAREEALRYALRAYVHGYSGNDPVERIPLSDPVLRTIAHVQATWGQARLRAQNLDELAAAAGVTRSHLCRLFEREMGIGPVRAFRMLRMERAALLLTQTTLSVTEISHRTGFGDEFHFSRMFRAATGSSPTEFRSDPFATFDLPVRLQPLSNRLWRQVADGASPGRRASRR